MIALVIGATGATGAHLVNCLIEDEYYTEIKVFVRRSVSFVSDKVQVFVVDFNNIADFSDEINGDVFFSCLGSTLKDAGSREDQWEIDFNIPYDFAKVAHVNGVRTCVLVSSFGADASSLFFYSRLKGCLEESLRELDFDNLIIFRPGILDRNKTNRVGEYIAVKMLYLLNALKMFTKYKPLPTPTLAEKLVKASKIEKKKKIFELDEINVY